VVLFLASVAFIVLAACIIPIAFQARRRLAELVLTAELLKPKLEVLAQDGRELVRSVTDLSKRANKHMDDVGKMVSTAHQWTERADRIVNEVGSVIEPPAFALVRNMNLFRTGATAFLRTLFHPNQNNNQTKQEKDHV
jgi:uncharacterized protein YoxC